ncbi:MAG: DNA polymerase I [Lachnospiraceae bacterium]|nr:DNA polymerase I [Lachnospiraceae bacterium]
MGKIVLIDGHSIMNRAYHGLPDLTTFSGHHTNAVLGFLNIMLRFLDNFSPEYLTVVFDEEQPTFRHKEFSDYKAQRKPMDSQLAEQFPVIFKVLSAMNIKVIKKGGFEADDILGTIATKAEKEGIDAIIVSGDKDLLQLTSDHITVMVPTTAKGKTTVKEFTKDLFREEYGLPEPRMIIDLKAIMGDSSDNYKGVEGIGEKGATKLLQDFGSLEGIYENLDKITGKTLEKLNNGKESAFFCRWLATIKTDCDIDFSFDDAKADNIFTPEAYKVLKEYEIKSLLGRFEGVDQKESEKDAAPAAKTPVRPEPELVSVSGKEEVEKAFEKLSAEEVKDLGAYFVYYDLDDGYSKSIASVGIEAGEYAVNISLQGSASEEDVFNGINGLLKNGFRLFSYDLKEISEHFDEDAKDNIFDLSIATYVINPSKSEYTPADIAHEFVGTMLPEIKEKLGKLSLPEAFLQMDFTGENKKKASELMKGYAHAALLAGPVVIKRLNDIDSFKLFKEVEMPLMFALRDMETAGISVDRNALNSYGSMLSGEIKKLEAEVYKLAGEEFNINSPKQLGEILFEKMKLPGGKKTKTGYSTAADVLEKLREDDPIIDLILKYRTYTKLKSTYADGLGGFIAKDGRIHTKFNQTVTATGRLSSTDPNLQNIPVRRELGREIRKMFVPAKGCVFVDADYSQIELRLLAHMSGDQSLIDAYNEGQDIHRITAAKVFNVPFEEVTPLMRSNAKAVNFGIIYGMSSFGLGSEINVSRKEAEEYIKQYFETYPQIKRYLDSLVESARKNGYSTTLFNRRRPINEINDRNFMVRAGAERIAMNSPIQGTAADIMKIALVNAARALKKEGLKSRILLQVHDELLVEAPAEEVEKAAEIIKREMMNAAKLKVELAVSVGTGENWDDAH